MSDKTEIAWCDSTFNGWEGCQKVGPGCDHCYAEARNARYGGGTAINWGPGAPRRRTSVENWRKPLKWNRDHAKFVAEHGRRQRVFCSSLADVFDNAVDPQWRADLFHLIEQTPNLDWLLLTKRIGNAEKMIREARLSLVGSTRLVVPDVLPNVWLGATIVNQEEADRDIEKLLMTPARRRFLSIEPMLGPVDLQAWFDPTGMCCGQEMTSCEDCPASAEWIHGPTTEYAEDGSSYSSPAIDWVIVGGESGPGARPMHPDWARALRDQCTQYGVAFLFKQWGEWIAEGVEMPAPLKRMPDPYQRRWVADDAEDDRYTRTAAAVHKVGKKAAGRMLDGVTHDGFPT